MARTAVLPRGLAGVAGIACVVSLAGLASFAWACSSLRDTSQDVPVCPSWLDDMADSLATRCGACHGGEAPAGGYAVTEYLDVLGPGSDPVANAIAGDVDSRLVQQLDPDQADPDHAGFGDLHPLVADWVGRCRLAYARSRVHDPGLMNPADGQFHGKLVRRLRYDFAGCASCHGDEDNAGPAGAPCETCHPEGPTECVTCHGEVPGSGAHVAHTAAGVDCQLCHQVPGDYRDPGHVLGADGALDPSPAEVVFSGLAGRAEGATYDPDTGTCDGVYCHGPGVASGVDDASASLTTPRWNGGPDQARCGTCHGQPPSSHADDRCFACHSRVIDRAGNLQISRHVDGEVQVGKGLGTCSDCHGSGSDGVPPPTLDGAIATIELGVGAHLEHVNASNRLRGPIPCQACHDAPDGQSGGGPFGPGTRLDEPGHIDSPGPAEVFELADSSPFTGLAAAGGAVPGWDRAAATCSDVYCHGGGTTRLALDTAPGLVREPVWTVVGQGQAACGACHGVPPIDGLHGAALTPFDCITCHPDTVDGSGNIVLRPDGAGGLVSDHIDGEIDVL